VSVPERANSRARPGLQARPGSRATGSGRQATNGVRASIASQIGVARWSADAWSAIAATVAFIAITCWWLTQDRSIPIYDAGDQLETAFEYHAMLQSGNLFGPLTHESVYPIFAQIVGSLGAFIGGVNVASPIVAENLVFVPLLALGCYQTGRLLFGPLAGALAVVFVLGSSLLISLFHMFLLDAPLAAMVSVSVWLVLASEDFSRPGVSALAGLAVGLGMNVKVQFAPFLIGLILLVLARGGWRNRRGLVAFAVVALVVGIPWYAAHVSELGKMFELASSGPGTPPGNIPPTFSTANLTWYFWSVLNGQLLLPLFLFAFIGTLYTIATLSRDRAKRGVRLEFLWGGFLAWVVITFVTAHHDIRYGAPLLAYLAVLGTGWITLLPRPGRLAAIAVLGLCVAANVLGLDFGVGGEVKISLPRALASTGEPADAVVYTTTGFLVAAPARDGDVPGLLGALRREGVRTVTWSISQSTAPDFSFEGLLPLSRIAGLVPRVGEELQTLSSAEFATLIHEAAGARKIPACTTLSDGTAVWVVRYDRAAGKLAYYCPARAPHYYSIDALH
jgi:hypothetical protein